MYNYTCMFYLSLMCVSWLIMTVVMFEKKTTQKQTRNCKKNNNNAIYKPVFRHYGFSANKHLMSFILVVYYDKCIWGATNKCLMHFEIYRSSDGIVIIDRGHHHHHYYHHHLRKLLHAIFGTW